MTRDLTRQSALKPQVRFETLGCPKNEVDSDRMRAAVLAAGYDVTDDSDDAIVTVLNTCAFILPAIEEAIDEIISISQEWLAAHPGRHLVVTGCLPSRFGSDLETDLPEVAAFIPVARESELVATIARLTGVNPTIPSGPVPLRTISGPSAYLQIADGCFRTCAYCTIPSIRGPYRSRPLPDIVAEAESLIAGGVLEIILIGQDTSSWGRDLEGDETLATVVRAVSTLPGLRWLRIMYVQPDGVTDDLLTAMSESPTVCRYLDIPLQHASTDVLRRMRRSGSTESFLQLVERIRSAVPGVVLRTSLIAGFPGETRGDAAELLRFLAAARLDYVGVFVYSPEDGTDAAAMPDRVPPRTARARAQRIRDLSDSIGLARAEERLGDTLDVLVEGHEDDGTIRGRWQGQAPEVDGVVLLDRGEIGTMVRARVVDTEGYDLVSQVV